MFCYLPTGKSGSTIACQNHKNKAPLPASPQRCLSFLYSSPIMMNTIQACEAHRRETLSPPSGVADWLVEN